MKNPKIALLFILGALFLVTGIYYDNISFRYLGLGTWSSGLVFFILYPKYKEITSMILGLLVLHAGVLLILKDSYSNPKLLGYLVFTIGIVFVLNSGFSDYMKKRKK